MSQEKKSEGTEDELLDHEYDGILEFDNPMPRWWTRIYWGSFWFSLLYLFHYWAGNGVSVEDAYESEMEVVYAERAEAALKQSVSEASLQQLLADKVSVAKGAEVFAARCVTCHLEKGQGLVGPNLTDNQWIHGHGKLMDIYGVVGEGVPAKGMPAWARTISPEELKQVVSFVGTLRGTNVPGKPPEGTQVP